MKGVSNEFIEINTMEKRVASSSKLMNMYPAKVPVIVILSKELKQDRKFFKYLVAKDLSMQYLIMLVRKNVKLDSRKAIFILTENGTLLTSSMAIGTIYGCNKNPDGYLYMYVKVENTFGEFVGN
jgi:hypothetical protein